MLSPKVCVTLVCLAFTPALVAQVPFNPDPDLPIQFDFQSNTGFISSYLYRNPTTTSPMTVYDPGTYTFAANLLAPIPVHPDRTIPSFFDHTVGNATGSYMIINGSTDVGKSFFSTATAIHPNTDYTFTMWSAVWNDSMNNLPRLQVSINGTAVGLAIPSIPLGTWTNFTLTWNSGSNTTAQIDLVDLNVDYSGNDFAIDDISFSVAGGIAAVPEPSTLALMGVALLGTGGYWMHQRRAKRISKAASKASTR